MSSSGLTWVKSTYSGQGNCVEVAGHGSRVLVRDTQDRSGPVLRISPAAWRRFAGRMKRSLASGPGRRVGTTRSVPWARTELQRAGQLVVSRTAAPKLAAAWNQSWTAFANHIHHSAISTVSKPRHDFRVSSRGHLNATSNPCRGAGQP